MKNRIWREWKFSNIQELLLVLMEKIQQEINTTKKVTLSWYQTCSTIFWKRNALAINGLLWMEK